MEQRQLGNEGPMIPVLGFGAWPIGGGMGAVAEAEAIATIHAAIENGITLIDTAQAYRTSETVIGKALADGRRQRVFLATKVSGHYSRGAIRTAIENSLRELRTDYVDLYQVHWWNPHYPIEETMSTLDALRKEGKTRFLGVSNFSAVQMEEALRVTPFHSLQPRYNLLDRHIETEILPFCEREGIGILAHSPLAKGLLTGKYRSGYRFPDDDERSQMASFQEESLRRIEPLLDGLTEIARSRGKTLIQLAIAALLRQHGVTCVLVGAKNPNQIEEHVGAQGWSLTDEEWSRIEQLLAS
jgi:aryl-alcohol dehydrogenase-like predicted oxidoreductase